MPKIKDRILQMYKKLKPTTKTKPTFLQRFGLFFYNHKQITILYWLAILVFGATSYLTLMQRQGFPNVDVPISIVNGSYFVNDKQTVDSQITKPFSQLLTRIDSVKSVKASSYDNFYNIIILYKDGTSSSGGNSEVQQALNNSNLLPKQATVNFKAIDAGRFAEQSDLLISVSSTNLMSASQLQNSASQLSKEFAKVDGVKKATVFEQVQSGFSPTEGKIVNKQTSYDLIGLHDGSGGFLFNDSIIIGVAAEPTTDALKLYDSISQKIDLLATTDQFSGLKSTIVADFAEGVRSQISSLQKNLLEGLLVVLIVSLLLISFRSGLAIASAMVTVLLATVGLLYGLGITLNTITLFALILSLGLIVDDTTIMVEAIDAAKGSSTAEQRRKSLATAIKKVARASMSGTLVTMLAFAPMLFIGGVLGDFIRIMPISIIVALAVSFIVSQSLVPFLARFLLHQKATTPKAGPITRIEKALSSTVASGIVRSGKSTISKLVYGTLAILFGIVVTAASIPIFAKLKFDIFPATKNTDQLLVGLRFSEGTAIDTAKQISRDASYVIANTLGKNATKITYQGTGQDLSSSIFIKLTSIDSRKTTSLQMIDQLKSAFTGFTDASVKVSQIDAGPGKDDYPFNVNIYENNEQKARALAVDMQNYMQGLSVKRANNKTATINKTIISPNSTILSSNAKQYISVSAGFDADDVSALVEPAKKALLAKYDSLVLQRFGINSNQLEFDFGNESNNQDSFKSMLLAFPLLLLVMFLLLAFQFKSWLQPLLIFAAIPFSFFGVASGLYITNNPLSFFVLVGFFALIGIAVNNTILLTDYANQYKQDNNSDDSYLAISNSIKARFRPLITTSLTSIVALTPLALSDPFWQSLSVTLIFGLITSTLLVVLVFPYIYLLGEDLKLIGYKIWNRQLARPLQILADVIIAPIRLVRYVYWIIFAWRNN